MNTLTAVRQEVADALTAVGIEALDYIPEVVNPPLAIISAGEPWLADGPNKTFQDIEVRLSIRLVAAHATNEDATDALDQMVVKALLALGWNLERVTQPFPYEVNGNLYLAADAVITASINIKEVI